MLSQLSSAALRRASVAGVMGVRVPVLRGMATAAATHKSDVIFSPTDSVELNTVLTEILHKIILPMRLPSAQRKFVFKEQFRQRLQTDPIVIEVDGYEHRFETLNYEKNDLPNSRSIYLKAINLMKTPEDWDNLVRLLSGYENSQRLIRPGHRYLTITKAGETGNIWAIIDALKRVDKSKFTVNYLPFIDEILHWLLQKTLRAEYAPKAARQASAWATMVMDFLETPEHRRPAALAEGKRPLHREPHVLAQYLMLQAQHSVYRDNCRDPHNAILKTATVLALEWTKGKSLLELNPLPEGTPVSRETWKEKRRIDYTEDYYLHFNIDKQISIAATTVKAVELAKQVLGDKLAKELDDVAAGAKRDLDAALEARKEGEGEKGLAVYKALFGDEKVIPVVVEEEAPVEGEAKE